MIQETLIQRAPLTMGSPAVRQTAVWLVCLACVIPLSATSGLAQEPAAEKITFDDHVKPLLNKRCSSCHNSTKKTADLDVTNYTALMMGGGSGEVIVPGDSAESYLYQLITYEESPEMPPSQKMPDPDIELVRNWIDGGALENSGSTARITKPKFDMAVGDSAMTKPEVVPMPGRLSLEPGLTTPHPGAVTAMAVSPWAPLVAIAAPGQIVWYDTSSLQLVGILPLPREEDHPTSAHSMRFSRNGGLLVAGVGRAGASGRVMLWDVATGELVATLAEELDSILAIDISPDHSMIAIGGPSKVVKVLNAADGSLKYEITKHTEWVTSVEFSPDSEYLATGDRNGGLYLWRAAGGDEHQTLGAHTKEITGISWRADGKALASVSEDATARIWEAETGKELKGWSAHGGGATSVQYERDGNITTTGRDNIAKLWNPEGTAILNYEAMSDVAVAVRYCETTQRIICADWTGNIRVFNGPDGAALGTLAPNPPDLATRLAGAQADAARSAEELQPLETRRTELETSLAAAQGTLQAAVQERDGVEAKYNELTAQIATAQKQLESTETSRTEWRTELGQLNLALPLVKDSQHKSVEAVAALPEDADLKLSVEKLGEKITQIQTRTTELDQLVAKSDETQQTTQASLDQMQTALAGEQTMRDALNLKVTTLETEVGTLNDALMEHLKLVETARAKVAATGGAVARWTGEIEFFNQLNSLRELLNTARQSVVEQGESESAVEQRLAAVQAELHAAKQKHAEAVQQEDALEQQILELKQK